jgi:hypothetical protein
MVCTSAWARERERERERDRDRDRDREYMKAMPGETGKGRRGSVFAIERRTRERGR